MLSDPYLRFCLRGKIVTNLYTSRHASTQNDGRNKTLTGLPSLSLCARKRLGGFAHNAPSGIAQLRKSSELNVSTSEPMNLDDFIVADSLAPPSGISNSPSPDLATQSKNKPLRSQINAIPINPHKPRQASLPHFGPQSVPVPPHAPNAQREFGYITRHHRKTSIDERRVSHIPCCARHKMASISWLFLFYHVQCGD